MAGRYVGQTAVGIAAAVRSGQVSPVEVLEQHLERIAALDGRLGAFRVLRTEQVRAEARALEERGDLAELPLAGVPVAIKDNVDLAGVPTRNGSAATSDEPAAADAELVRRLREAGALLVGKTNVPELCLWPFNESEAFGDSRNPWSLDHTPGGSIRMPASNCGLVGIKPGPGVVPFPSGGVWTWSGMSEFGPLATTVADLGLGLEVLAGGGGYRAVAPPERPLRVGVSVKPGAVGVKVDPEVVAAVEKTAEALAEAGHQVETADPPWHNGDAAPFLRRVFYGCAEDTDRLRWEALEPRTRAEARVGRTLRRARPAPSGPPERVAARYRAWFSDHDLLLSPTLAAPPLRVGAYQGKGLARTVLGLTGYMPFCPPLNLVGFPAMSVPAGTSAEGLPLGAQLAAVPGGEALLLSVARQLETLRPWPRHAPLEPLDAPPQRS